MLGKYIKKVVVTEKAYTHPGAVVVEVIPAASKTDVRNEFKALYGDKLEISQIRTTTLPKKISRQRTRVKRRDVKRAYIYLKNKEGFDFTSFK